MSIQLKRGSGAPLSLDDGEFALDLTNLAIYAGSTGVKKLLGAPVDEGTTPDAMLSWNDSTKRWEEATGLRVDGGTLIQAYTNLRLRDSVDLRFGTGDDVTVEFNGTDLVGTIADTAAVTLSDSGGVRLKLRTDNNVEIGGTTIYTDAAVSPQAFNTGFERIRVLNSATYNALGVSEDPDTIYLITLT